jgi:hypothetical protein
MFKKDESSQAPSEALSKPQECLSLTPQELANLRKNKPEQIVDTPEWKFMVRLDAISALYDISGLIIDLP